MMTKKEIDWRIVCIGLICLTSYGIYAASKGIDGIIMSVIIGVIALAIGVTIPSFIKSK